MAYLNYLFFLFSFFFYDGSVNLNIPYKSIVNFFIVLFHIFEMSNSALQRDVTKFAPQCRAIKLQVQAGDQAASACGD